MDQYGEPPAKGSSGLKIVLWVLGITLLVLVLLCGGGGFLVYRAVKGGISQDPVAIRQATDTITEIDLPPSYPPSFMLQMMGVKMVMYGVAQGQQNSGVLMMMEFPKNMGGDPEQMRLQMQQSAQQQAGQGSNIRVESSESRTYTIRGQEETVTISRGAGEDSQKMVQAIATFSSKQGNPAMLMVMTPEDKWNDEEFAAILQSMR